jgi:hypothetical protein
MTSELLFELAWLFQMESIRENNSKKGDGGEAMRLFCISLELNEQAVKKRREEVEAIYMGELE